MRRRYEYRPVRRVAGLPRTGALAALLFAHCLSGADAAAAPPPKDPPPKAPLKAPEPTPESLVSALRRGDMETRLKAAEALRRLARLGKLARSERTAARALTAMLADGDAKLRKAALAALDDIGARAGPSAEAVAKLAADSDAGVRKAAASALSSLANPHPAAMEALVALAEDSDPEVRKEAEMSLWLFGEDAAAAVPLMRIRATTPDLDPDLRRDAIRIIGTAAKGDPAIVKVLIGLLSDKHWEVRRQAAYCLSWAGAAAKSAEPAFRAALKSEDRNGWEAAAGGLRGIGAELDSAADLLAERMRTSQQSWVRSNCVDALAELGPAAGRALKELISALDDADVAYSRRAVFGALENCGPAAAAALPRLIALFDESDSLDSWMSSLVVLLGKMGPAAEAAVPKLLPVLSDRDLLFGPRRRAAAAMALAKIGRRTDTVVPAIRKLLDDKEPVVKTAAAAALVMLEPAGATESAGMALLTAALKSEDRRLRGIAVLRLAELGAAAAPAVPELVRLLELGDEGTCRGIAWALGEIGPAAAASAEKLRELLDDDSYPIRKIAAAALKKIERK